MGIPRPARLCAWRRRETRRISDGFLVITKRLIRRLGNREKTRCGNSRLGSLALGAASAIGKYATVKPRIGDREDFIIAFQLRAYHARVFSGRAELPAATDYKVGATHENPVQFRYRVNTELLRNIENMCVGLRVASHRNGVCQRIEATVEIRKERQMLGQRLLLNESNERSLQTIFFSEYFRGKPASVLLKRIKSKKEHRKAEYGGRPPRCHAVFPEIADKPVHRQGAQQCERRHHGYKIIISEIAAAACGADSPYRPRDEKQEWQIRTPEKSVAAREHRQR